MVHALLRAEQSRTVGQGCADVAQHVELDAPNQGIEPVAVDGDNLVQFGGHRRYFSAGPVEETSAQRGQCTGTHVQGRTTAGTDDNSSCAMAGRCKDQLPGAEGAGPERIPLVVSEQLEPAGRSHLDKGDVLSYTVGSLDRPTQGISDLFSFRAATGQSQPLFLA